MRHVTVDPLGLGIFELLYTGDWNASAETYAAAKEGAGDYFLGRHGDAIRSTSTSGVAKTLVAISVGEAEIRSVDAANWTLTGETNPDREKLEAATEAYIRHLGLNPFDTKKSLGQWVYTGSWEADQESVRAAIGAAQCEVRKEWDCYKECMKQANSFLLAPIIGGTAYTSPFFLTPKSWIKPFLTAPLYRRYISTTSWGMIVTHLEAIAKSRGNIPLMRRLAAIRRDWKASWRVQTAAGRKTLPLKAVEKYANRFVKGAIIA